MVTREEYNRFGEDLENILLLRTSPLAVKMLENESDIPENAVRPKRDRGHHLAQCQAFSLSRRQKITVAMLKEDHWCWGPLIAYGLVDPALSESFSEIKKQVKLMPRLDYGRYIGLVSAPLRTAGFIPDVVLIYCNNAQLRNMLLSMKYSGEPLVTSIFDPIDSCAYAVIPALSGQFRITLPDPGEYDRALAAEDEIIFSVPGDKLELLLTCLRRAESRQSGYKILI